MAFSFNEAPKAGSNRKIPPAGTHAARLVQLIDLGIQDRPAFQGEEKKPCHQLHLTFELVDEKDEFNGELKPFWVSRTVNYSDHEKSALMKYRSAIDPSAKDVTDLMDKPCMVEVAHKEWKGKTFANITNVTPAPKKLTVDSLSSPVRVIDFSDGDIDAFNELPDFLKNMMTKAHNWSSSPLGRAVDGQGPEDEVPF